MRGIAQLCVRDEAERIRVFVAESNRMASQLMESILLRHRHKFEIKASNHGYAEAFLELQKYQPHVAVISAELGDGTLTGFRLLQQLRDAGSNAAPIMLLNSTDRDLLIDAFRYGARGVFMRAHPINVLPKCISAVHNGQVWISNDQIQMLLDLVTSLRPFKVVKSGGMALLTPRELQIVAQVVEGLRNEEIAKELNLTEHTVRNYLSRICEKLGLSGRVELILYALSRKE